MKGERGTIELPVARDLHRRSRMTARRREDAKRAQTGVCGCGSARYLDRSGSAHR